VSIPIRILPSVSLTAVVVSKPAVTAADGGSDVRAAAPTAIKTGPATCGDTVAVIEARHSSSCTNAVPGDSVSPRPPERKTR
jgi:hypothetical protein